MGLVRDLELPANLVRASGQDLDDRRRSWVARLPAIVADLADRWALTLEPPFQPGGECSWTAPAATPPAATWC